MKLNCNKYSLDENLIVQIPLKFVDKFNRYNKQQNKCYPKGFYLTISMLYSILVVANLLAHNNITINHYNHYKIECSFEICK